MTLIKKGSFALAIISSAVFMNLSYAADPAPNAPANAAANAPADTAAPSATATNAAAPKFDCILTDTVDNAGRPGAAKNAFQQTTPLIYLICQSDQVKKGQIVKAEWIADDTHNAAPANYKIQEKSVDVSRQPTGDEVFTANFSLSKPDKGWPAGTYHVALFVDNSPLKSVNFSVQ